MAVLVAVLVSVAVVVVMLVTVELVVLTVVEVVVLVVVTVVVLGSGSRASPIITHEVPNDALSTIVLESRSVKSPRMSSTAHTIFPKPTFDL